MIQFKQVNFGYEKAFLTSEALSLSTGKVYALIGKNGAGKSTFLKTIKGDIPCLSGEIVVNNKPLKSYNKRALAKEIAYVSSKFDGIDYMSTEEYVALGRTPYLSLLGEYTKEDFTVVSHAIERLKINHLRQKQTTTLSDGERQLAAIARALTQETNIILLDEPTAFLDYSNRMLLIEELMIIAKELNKCIIFSSHDIDLCLEHDIDLLVIEKEKRQVSFFPAQSITKNQLIQFAF